MPELSPHPCRASPASGSPFGQALLEAQAISNSHHYLSTHYSNDLFFRNVSMTEPNLHGLVESEVFVGEEPSFLDDASYSTGVIPSPLSISYHKEGYLQPLNSVKEEIEAEAAEEQLSGNFHSLDYLGLSLGPSSLSSSVISSNSLEDAMNGADHINCFRKNTSTVNASKTEACKGLLKGLNDPKLKLKCIQQANYRDALSPGGSVRCSPRLVRTSPPHSARSYSSKDDIPFYDRSGCKGSPQKYNKNENTNKICTDKRNPVWHNPSKSDKLFGSKRENSISFRREGSYRAKSEARERENNVNGDLKFSSLPRRKKENSDKDIVAETYGTLGRNRKPRVPPATPEMSLRSSHCHNNLPQESKNILDKYATLPRKKAKEISSRWHDQNKEIIDNRPPFQRSKSIGKNESPSNGSSANFAQSPRSSSRPTKPNRSKPTSPSARLLARQNSLGKERTEKTPPPLSYSNVKHTKTSKVTKKNAEVQVNIKWDPDEHELEEKLRSLSEEHSLVNGRLKRAELTAEEVEQLRMEAVELRRVAEMEKMDKEELQDELDRTSSKVKDMLTSMEGVEKEFNNRGESLIEFENQLQNSTTINIKMQERINQYEDYSIKIKKDLDKSLAAQKILLQQVQDLEAEGREIAEFMSEEKNALSECLKEAEMEITKQRKELERLSENLQLKDEEAKQMIKVAEERRQGFVSLQTELHCMQTSTEDTMVCQGAQLLGASVGLSNLTARVNAITARLVQDYSISENDIENVVTPHGSDSSVSSSTNGTPQKSPSRCPPTRSPRKPASFMHSFLSAISTAHSATRLITSLRDKESACEPAKLPGGPSSVSLNDQVTEVDLLLSRLLKVCCVLKSDADNILSELEDENERLCSQLQLQQQVIDQQHADVDSLRTLEGNARKELQLIASQSLNNHEDELEDHHQPEIDYVVSHVLKTLESIPEVVSGCSALRDLYAQLNTSENEHKSPSPVKRTEMKTYPIIAGQRVKVNGCGTSRETQADDCNIPAALEADCASNTTLEVGVDCCNPPGVGVEGSTTLEVGDDCSTALEVGVDCNANPEVPLVPSKLIPLLTHETPL